MKFPYGICDFRKIIRDQYLYIDRTDRIPLLEKNVYQLFLRPRRFGKSLLLSMLANYYDIVRKDEFDPLFGSLAIGKHPTLLRNRFLILEWDFSCIDPSGTADDIKRALHDHINDRIRAFLLYYRQFDIPDVIVNPDNAVSSIDSLAASVRMTGHPIYLLIDEYDNFANEVLMGVRKTENIYEALVYEEGPLKTLFKSVKSSTKASVFDRIFITGVSPVVMSDITSGYNIGENIYLEPAFNDLCGFTEPETEDVIRTIAQTCRFDDQTVNTAIHLMRTYYNGYSFSIDAESPVYNPTLALYFMKTFESTCKFPREMLDENMSADDAKLQYIAQISGGGQLLLDLLNIHHRIVIPKIAHRFGIKRLLNTVSHDNLFMTCFLYYFGVLTLDGETEKGGLKLKVPNLVVQGLYVERIQELLLPEPSERDKGKSAAEKVWKNGDIEPLCEFVETTCFKVFRNADYKWANEFTVKTAFLTLLYNDILYIMDSEPELDRRYADLTMIIRPDMRRFHIFDVLIEFKYVKLGDAGVSGEDARKLTDDELHSLASVKSAMEKAVSQITDYRRSLQKRYGNDLRLKCFAVVSLGFDRIWGREVANL